MAKLIKGKMRKKKSNETDISSKLLHEGPLPTILLQEIYSYVIESKLGYLYAYQNTIDVFTPESHNFIFTKNPLASMKFNSFTGAQHFMQIIYDRMGIECNIKCLSFKCYTTNYTTSIALAK